MFHCKFIIPSTQMSKGVIKRSIVMKRDYELSSHWTELSLNYIVQVVQSLTSRTDYNKMKKRTTANTVYGAEGAPPGKCRHIFLYYYYECAGRSACLSISYLLS
jgi:hypothetical protein